MSARKHVALACAALVAAAGTTVVAAPAQAKASGPKAGASSTSTSPTERSRPTGATGLDQSVTATLSTLLNVIERCKTDAQGNTTECTRVSTGGTPAEEIRLTLDYTVWLEGTTAALPNVLSRTGTRGCSSVVNGETVYRAGMTLLAGPGELSRGERYVEVNGDEVAYLPRSDAREEYVSEAVCAPSLIGQ